MSAFSFCIYGPMNPLYYTGLLENLELVRRHYPASWRVFVYTGADVPEDYKERLRSYPNVVLRETGELGMLNRVHRFFAMNEEGVEVLFVRDADSRIHWRDRWTIQHFLSNPQFLAETTRDHKQHTAKMMGGLWAIRRIAGIDMRHELDIYKRKVVNHGYAYDQDFLTERVYPQVRRRMVVHRCSDAPIFDKEHDVLIPFPYSFDIYCGRVENTDYADAPMPTSFLDRK